MNKYKMPITYEMIEEQDQKMENAMSARYKDDIQHFKRTAELYIALFSNSKRTNRAEGKIDYMQLVAVRIFHDCRSALLLGLKGLFPQSIGLTRGTLESIFLLYDFHLHPENEDIWFNAGKKKREEMFKASEVRKRIKDEVQDVVTIGTHLYNSLSDWTIHSNRESYIWYIETVDGKLKYHWAGHGNDKRADYAVLSAVYSLGQGLFVLFEEGLYGVTQEWMDDFYEWKKEHLEFSKRFAKIFGIKNMEGLEVKVPIIIPQNKKDEK